MIAVSERNLLVVYRCAALVAMTPPSCGCDPKGPTQSTASLRVHMSQPPSPAAGFARSAPSLAAPPCSNRGPSRIEHVSAVSLRRSQAQRPIPTISAAETVGQAAEAHDAAAFQKFASCMCHGWSALKSCALSAITMGALESDCRRDTSASRWSSCERQYPQQRTAAKVAALSDKDGGASRDKERGRDDMWRFGVPAEDTPGLARG